MNAFALFVLTALTAEFILARIADLLNLRTLGAPVPPEFAGIIDRDAAAKTAAYTRERTVLGMAASGAGFATFLVFWFAGGFGWLDALVRQAQLGDIAGGLVYAALLAAGRGILALPFSLYGTFVIEQRFGFNTTTVSTYVADRMKMLLLGLLIGAPLLAGILWLFAAAGPTAWLVCWGAVTAVMFGLQYVAPSWIMPLFNTFSPLPEGDLRGAIEALARKLRFPLEGVYVADGSRRSRKANAFFTGFGKRKRIVLLDTLLGRHTTQELVAVLAHEIGHFKKRHVLVSLVIGVLHSGVLFWLLSVFAGARGLFEAFGVRDPSVYAGLILLGFLVAPAEFFVGLALAALSRRHEYAADRYAAEATERPGDLIEALKKLSKDHAAHLTPHPFYVKLHYSHPPVVERIRALAAQAAAPGGGGDAVR